MDNLTPRQWKLYNLLKTNPNKWFSQKEICETIVEYPYYEKGTNHCPFITEDKLAINSSDLVDKIIVIKSNCYKIANEDEYKRERASHIRRLKVQAQQIRDMDRKYNQDGYGKLLNNILNELKPENEQWHETFVNENDTPTISTDQSENAEVSHE